MKPELFRESLDRYGADLENWPADLRSEAEMALRQSEEIRGILEMERRFEAELNLEIPEPSVGLARRICAAAAVTPQELGTRVEKNGAIAGIKAWFQPKPAFAWACLLVLGFILGFWEADRRSATPASTTLASLYNDGDTSWISELNSSY